MDQWRLCPSGLHAHLQPLSSSLKCSSSSIPSSFFFFSILEMSLTVGSPLYSLYYTSLKQKNEACNSQRC